MDKEEIREIVKQTVKATLRELFSDDIPPRPYSGRSEYLYRFEDSVEKLSFLVSDFEKTWQKPPKCLYEKSKIDSIKSDTRKIK